MDKESSASELPPAAQSTGGIELSTSHRALAEAIELLSSMRFAISALVVVCIASAIGTIVAQNSPPINYVNQFGAFWAEVFTSLSVVSVYNASWFLLVMGLMLASTSLCLLRNTPKMLKDMRAWREKVRDTAFPAFHHRAEVKLPAAQSSQALSDIASALASRGYKLRTASEPAAGMPMLVAKKGGANRLGYISAHLAIVVISLGGLLDSEVPLKAVAWWLDKTPMQMSSLQGSQVPTSSLLPVSTPTYRANLLIPEGGRGDVALVPQGDRVFLLDLPFELSLKQFRIEYYPTGMPKLFASDVVLKDKATGEEKTATIEVNKPLIHRGVAIYQSSFDDGGSSLNLAVFPMMGSSRSVLPVEIKVGQSTGLSNGDQKLSLEISGFKPINVENMGPGADAASDAAPADPFQKNVASVLSPAVNANKAKTLRNIGPSITYKLRDASGQAREFHTYMLPVELDGARVFLAGVRNSPDEGFRYMRIPADAKDSMDEFMRIRAALDDPAMRQLAAKRFATQATNATMVGPLAESADRALSAVAQGGLDNLGRLLESSVPEAERERAADVILRLLTSSFWELWQQARAKDGLAPVAKNEENVRFAQLSLSAVSDAKIFSAPLLVGLKDFKEVKASVFQVTRSPGKTTVYLGCLLLTLGVFAMLYIQERRVWVWVKQQADEVTVRLAASTPRATIDFEKEFSAITQVTTGHGPVKPPASTSA